jgi:hypothetical protein
VDVCIIGIVKTIMKFLLTSTTFPFSAAVIHSGRTLETALTPIPPGETEPVKGGAGAKLREIFRQLYQILEMARTERRWSSTADSTYKMFCATLRKSIAFTREYFGTHRSNRRAYGIVLQAGMLVEAAFVAEVEV